MLLSRLPLVFLVLINACSLDEPTVSEWKLSESGLYASDISHDGKFAVISSFREGVSYWNIEKSKKLYDWSHGKQAITAISHVKFSPDSQYVMTADLRSFVVWDASSGEALGFWSVESDILDIAVSNNAKYVLLGLKDGRAMHINLKTQRRLEVIAHRDERVTTVDLTPSGKYALTGGNDHRAVIWNAATGKEHQTFEMSSRVKLVKFDKKGSRAFVSTEKNQAYVYSSKSGKQIIQLRFKPRQGSVSSARFSKDGKHVLLGFPGRYLSLWDLKTGIGIKEWRVPNKTVGLSPQSATTYSVEFLDNNKKIMAQASNGLGASWQLTP